MYMFGFGGYLFAGSATQGNILLNVRQQADVRHAHGGVMPCRESILEVVDLWFETPEEVTEKHAGEQTALIRQEPIQQDTLFRNPVVHYASTLAIILTCYFGAWSGSGLESLWLVHGILGCLHSTRCLLLED
jgi:hypothetical protein